ncbi:MAG TPA: 30S ribosomal protein S6 [Candidatus Polarisedimenticolia bacterium]|nr:30S ribosomal protein S6 [Candidatus Polarisedimenticolia bacterium]
MVKYESIFVADPGATDDEIGALVKVFEETISSGEGKVLKVERWGKRRLAYRIGKFEDGNYTLLFLDCPPAATKELERRYRMNDKIIKYLTVRMAENMREAAPVPAAQTVEAPPGEAEDRE